MTEDSKLIASIRSQLEERSSDDLLDIWRSNDRSQWSAECFSAIEQIIKGRGLDLPPQNEPIVTTVEIPDAAPLKKSIMTLNQVFLLYVFIPYLLGTKLIMGRVRELVSSGGNDYFDVATIMPLMLIFYVILSLYFVFAVIKVVRHARTVSGSRWSAVLDITFSVIFCADTFLATASSIRAEL